MLLLVDLIRSIISSPFYTILTRVLTLGDYYYNEIILTNICNNLYKATLLTSINKTIFVYYFRITPKDLLRYYYFNTLASIFTSKEIKRLI